ncbi:MAG: hypothetical protein ACREGJ_03115 [Candidatus Saccharimonadales bacterium]
MISLEQYDIQPGRGSASLQQSERGHLPVGEFFDQAVDLLPAIDETLKSDIIPSLEQREGRWHPSGYMVYPLGTHPTLGSLRFHIWPAGMRLREDREGPLRDVHDHVVHIASIAAKGTYSDNIYRVEAHGSGVSDEEVAARGLLRVFMPPSDKSGSEAMTTDGRVVRAYEIGRRVVPQGNTHTIEVGVFHAPTIPEDEIGATLSFSSYRVALAGPHILVGGSTEPIVGQKRLVTPEQAAMVKEQLTT